MGIKSLAVFLALTLATLFALSLDTRYALFVPGLIEGAWLTVRLAVLGCIVAVLLAIGAALAKLYGPAPLRWLAVTYIEVFRGMFALVQLFWLFFVLPGFGISLEPFTVGVLGLGLNIGAYGAEVVRGAISAVSRGQWEATIALNMTRAQALRRVVLPQAFAAMIPPWGNLFIELLKSTALVSLITLTDLAFKAQQMNQTTMKTVPIFTLVLLIYLAMSLTITIGVRALELRVTRGLLRGRGA